VAGSAARGGDAVTPRNANAVDKRRLILDAAIRVFAREGFHRCRVSDIANEAGVAYGLVYHYFRSKDEVLDTLFTERWTLLLEAIAEVDARNLPIRDKLHAIASFIIGSYENDPDLMKVIIVEVTRAANTFGRAHLEEISQAYEGIGAIFRKAQDEGSFRTDISPEFGTLCFYGAIEQLLTAWIFEAIPATPDDFAKAKEMVVETVCGGLELRV
jgi:TetR/AcrR family fatty acid metabolism transcriptional regulator